MTTEQKQFFRELANLLEKHNARIDPINYIDIYFEGDQLHDLEVVQMDSPGFDEDITPKYLRELLKSEKN